MGRIGSTRMLSTFSWDRIAKLRLEAYEAALSGRTDKAA
jgi:hypothetical protein